jgi:hypothetical protein
MFNCICDLPRVWAWYFRDRICLANNKQVLDLTDVILGLALDRAPIRSVMKCALRGE